jgi:hypothetical protein
MGTLAPGFAGSVAAVFLLADNRQLREAWSRILSKKDDIQVVGCGSYGPATFDQIASTASQRGCARLRLFYFIGRSSYAPTASTER